MTCCYKTSGKIHYFLFLGSYFLVHLVFLDHGTHGQAGVPFASVCHYRMCRNHGVLNYRRVYMTLIIAFKACNLERRGRNAFYIQPTAESPALLEQPCRKVMVIPLLNLLSSENNLMMNCFYPSVSPILLIWGWTGRCGVGLFHRYGIPYPYLMVVHAREMLYL